MASALSYVLEVVSAADLSLAHPAFSEIATVVLAIGYVHLLDMHSL
jgi:hypothetical protein